MQWKSSVFGQVLHSQRLSKECLSCWLIVEEDGRILSTHCNCVAGLGEKCTHVCAVLFFIDMAVRKLTDQTPTSVTDVKAYWKVPSKIAEPQKIVDMNFITPSKIMEERCAGPLYRRESESCSTIPSLSKEELLNNVRLKILINITSCLIEWMCCAL